VTHPLKIAVLYCSMRCAVSLLWWTTCSCSFAVFTWCSFIWSFAHSRFVRCFPCAFDPFTFVFGLRTRKLYKPKKT